eukprot:15456205-Heterocapsa_arctica.AAC.1
MPTSRLRGELWGVARCFRSYTYIREHAVATATRTCERLESRHSGRKHRVLTRETGRRRRGLRPTSRHREEARIRMANPPG